MNSPLSKSYLLFLLDEALKAAKDASKAILQVYKCDASFIEKSDGSPLTAADLKSHISIVNALERSGLPVVSEENLVPYEERVNWDRFWLIDPLDGTKDFLALNDEFTVNIALIENGIPIIGVVAAPALNTVWYAANGCGAWKLQGDLLEGINALGQWPDETRMFVSRFHTDSESLKFSELNQIAHVIKVGSAIKLARLAASEAEFYPRYVGSSEWDIAAGHAILKEAGGLLLDIHAGEVVYNKPNLRNPFFIAWRPPIDWVQICLCMRATLKD